MPSVSRRYLVLKRAFDIAFCIIVMPIVVPLLLLRFCTEPSNDSQPRFKFPGTGFLSLECHDHGAIPQVEEMLIAHCDNSDRPRDRIVGRIVWRDHPSG
jgi:hypothetical protein